jgi:hypothetical protein
MTTPIGRGFLTLNKNDALHAPGDGSNSQLETFEESRG